MASLERTPTWAVATVCFLLILISISTEYLLHFLVKRVLYYAQQPNQIKPDLYFFFFFFLHVISFSVFQHQKKEIPQASSRQYQIRCAL